MFCNKLNIDITTCEYEKRTCEGCFYNNDKNLSKIREVDINDKIRRD